MSATVTLKCEALTVSVPGRTLLQDLDLELAQGTVLAVLGRNGAGKSSTLHTLAGLRAAQAGTVSLQQTTARVRGRDVNSHARSACCRSWSKIRFRQRRSKPCWSAVIRISISGPGKARPIGRSRAAVWRRSISRGSSRATSPRCRAASGAGYPIATILAQDPATFLLDEPIQQLDPQHQLDVLRRFRHLADAGRSVVMSLHDAGLAARFADTALLLFGDGRWLHGHVRDVLNERTIGELYGMPVRELRWNDGRTFVAA